MSISVDGRRVSVESLFQPLSINGCTLRNRIVMSPMSRQFATDGVLPDESIAYYARRAEGEAGLIITEGVAVNPQGSLDVNVPFFSGETALGQWKRVADAVHAHGGRIMPQLWHAGILRASQPARIDAGVASAGPSGFYPRLVDGKEAGPPQIVGETLSEADIERTIDDFGRFAETAKALGFDGIALHGAHGYLLDQFFWDAANRRSDRFNGDLAARTRFAVETIREIRRRVGPDFPIGLRFSQWKLPDYYRIKVFSTPGELETFLGPLVDAGVDFFDCSTRRFWEAEFAGSDLNLSGWTKKITGLTTMTVGSVGLDGPLMTTPGAMGSVRPEGLARLMTMFERGDFDLVGVGRAIIANPHWARLVRTGRDHELVSFDVAALRSLV